MTNCEVDLSTISHISDTDFFNNSEEIPDIILQDSNLKPEEFDCFDFLNSPVDLNDISIDSVKGSSHEESLDNLLFPNPSEEDLENIEFTADNYENFEFDEYQKNSRKKQPKIEIGYLNNEDLDHGKPGQKLFLTLEEKTLLLKSGHKIPTHLPITKSEDRALRTVRRKIRNKLSAKASRARRQKYLCGLEDQIEYRNQENINLKKKIFQLEQDKKSLISYVRRLRNFISSYIPDGVSSISKLPTVGKRALQKKSSDNQSLLPFYKHQNTLKATSYAKPAAGGTSLLVAVFIVLAWTAVVPLSEEKKIITKDEMTDYIPSRILLSKSQNSVIGPQTESFYNNQNSLKDKKDDFHKKDVDEVVKINRTHQENKRSSLPHIRIEPHKMVNTEVLISA